MIKKWKVGNFKSIKSETELEFAPLTIFTGTNSSGKSSFIQSILLVAQTLSSKMESQPVILNGELISLGNFNDLKFYDSVEDKITIGFTYQPLKKVNLESYKEESESVVEIKCEFSFDANDSNEKNKELRQVLPRLYSSDFRCKIENNDNGAIKESFFTAEYSDEPIKEPALIEFYKYRFNQSTREEFDYCVSLDDAFWHEENAALPNMGVEGCSFLHFMPKIPIVRIDAAKTAAFIPAEVMKNNFCLGLAVSSIYYPKDVQTNIQKEIMSSLRELFQKFLDECTIDGIDKEIPFFTTSDEYEKELTKETRDVIQQKLREYENLTDFLESAVRKVITEKNTEIYAYTNIYTPSTAMKNSFSRNLKYLAPLRYAPQILYSSSSNKEPSDIGLYGEYTAAVLNLYQSIEIKYIEPSAFEKSALKVKFLKESFATAIQKWLQYLGLADSFSSDYLGELGVKLQVSLNDSELKHDLTSVGVGVSQALPILVTCLLAEPGTILIFEQPELHLHPKVQTLLGDFFFSMALCSKQCIIETHSEYLIDRLRYRIVSSVEGDLIDKTKIYFAEKDNEGSRFREIVINKYGAITDWPEGFFDQSQEEAEKILMAAAKKRRAKKHVQKPIDE